jgi:starch synthase (maltosyl-transferring)
MNSEKYEIRQRNWDAPGNLNQEMRLLNTIRRQHAALQRASNLTFHPTDNPNIIFYRRAGTAAVSGKPSATAPTAVNAVADSSPRPALDRTSTGDEVLPNDILVAVNLDPKNPHHTTVEVPIAEMGIAPEQMYTVEDLLTGARYTWRGARNYVRLDPAQQPGHLLRVVR